MAPVITPRNIMGLITKTIIEKRLKNTPMLQLNLKKKWFDMIKSGEKKEEYREIKKSWSRIFSGGKIKIKGKYHDPHDVVICFSNGYQTYRPQFVIECIGLQTGHGNPNWGAEQGVDYFILKLGKIIEL